MAEGSELMSRLVSENADLKRQVRLLKENQMLKRLLSESCPERGRGAREPLLPRAPAYPEDGSPGAAGEAPPCRAWRPPGRRPARLAREPGAGLSAPCTPALASCAREAHQARPAGPLRRPRAPARACQRPGSPAQHHRGALASADTFL